MMKRIAVLGSTGSIGQNVLNVVLSFPDKFKIVALSAKSNIELLKAQEKKFKPDIVSLWDESGLEGLIKAATYKGCDIVVVATSGCDSIIPLFKAISAGKDIAIANKEPLVMAGKLIMKLAKERGINIIPIDSEHSAIFQCLQGEGNPRFVKRVYLTASGGPLLNVPKKEFDSVTPGQIIRHPKWIMGKKISVDSASLMNKGLEILEARWLFGISIDKIEVLIHPEAIVHSMVEFVDGSVLAQLGITDMRLPIQYALTYPERLPSTLPSLDFSNITTLNFSPPDLEKFPCLSMAIDAARQGGSLPAVLNAANEELVRHYLEGSIKFSQIPVFIEEVILRHKRIDEPTLEEILDTARWAREQARELAEKQYAKI